VSWSAPEGEFVAMNRRLLVIVTAGFAAMAIIAIVACQPVAHTQANTSARANAEFALALLKKVVEAGDQVSFKATQTVILWYPTGSNACITNVVHKAPNLTRTEYLPSATATSGYRIVISDGQSAWHYEPSLGVVFHMPGAGSRPDRQQKRGTPAATVDAAGGSTMRAVNAMSLIEANYEVSLVGTESLVGRKAHVIKLKPRHAGSPSRRIWVDTELPFILRTEKYGPNGLLSSLSFYNHIEFSPVISDDTFKIQVLPGVAIVTLPGVEDLVTLEELQKKAGFAITMPEFVPDGYVFEGGTLSPRGNLQVAHIRFTDGLNTISYFVAPLTGNEGPLRGDPTIADQFDMVSLGRRVALDGVKGQLANYQDAKLLRWRTSGYEFTLIGEVDESLLVEMAESVRAPEQRGPAKEPFPGQVVKFFYQFFWMGR